MSSKYWERRAAQRMFENMEEAEKAAEEVKKYYRASSEYLKSHAKTIFERYATKYGLTQVEARAMLDKLTKAKTVDEIINRLEEVEKGKGNLAKLDSPAYRHRIQRMMDLQQQVDVIMKKKYNLEKNYVDGFYERFIGQAYYKSLYETMQRIGFAVAFNHISEQQIADILNSKWYGKNYSERIWDNTQRLTEKLKEELFVCFVTGQTEKEAADKIAELFDQEYMVARRLIRTESAWMTNQMDQKAYKEAEIEYYRFTAVLDLRTSRICRDMDGKIFKVSEAIIGKNHPPMHPWCRSTTTPIIGQKYLDRMKRKFRNPETGEVETIPLNMTYKDWYRKYVKGTDAEKQDQVWKDGKIPGESKAASVNADNVPWEDFEKPAEMVRAKDIDNVNDTEYNGSIPSSWGKIPDTATDDAVKNANPLYNSKYEEGYDDNCPNCAVAYEMRKRGYDVTAAPMNGSKVLRRDPYLAWEDITPIETKGTGLEDIKAEMSKWEEGSRAEIMMDWKHNGNGHVVVAEVKDGAITMYDPQNGTVFSEKQFERVKEDSVKFWNISDAVISQRGATACEKKKK